MYDKGRGVPQDDAEAVKWYRRAAEQGDAKAQHNLGLLNLAGKGVPLDQAKSLEWFRKAAKSGYGPAQGQVDSMECVLQAGVPIGTLTKSKQDKSFTFSSVMTKSQTKRFTTCLEERGY